MKLHGEDLEIGQRVFWAPMGPGNNENTNGVVSDEYNDRFEVTFDGGQSYDFNQYGMCIQKVVRAFGRSATVPLEFRNIVGFEVRAKRDGGINFKGSVKIDG